MSDHLAPWSLMPPSQDVCQECAVDHPPEMPHNQQSLYYQYRFYQQHGRWPTWSDALAHCPDDIREATITVLRENGVNI